MENSKYFIVVVIVMFALSIAACGNYGDAEIALADYGQVIEEFVDDMEQADNSREVTAAINNYTREMEKIIPEMDKIVNEYPELCDEGEKPEEIKKKMLKLIEISKGLQPAIAKVEQYRDDPDVQRAMDGQERVLEDWRK